MVEAAAAGSGWAVGKAVWSRMRGLWARGRDVAALVREVTTLRTDVASLKTQVGELQRRAVPAEPEVDEKLGVWTGMVGGKRHNFCPVCWGKGEFMLLQHEPDKNPPWRCAECRRCFPGGYKGRVSDAPPPPRVVRSSWMQRTRLSGPSF